MGFPDVSDAFWDWTNPIRFKLLQTTVADFEVAERPISAIIFDGVLEPLRARDLLVKPENQRRWRWWTLWTKFDLQPGQVIEDPQGIQYRIMGSQNWANGGYFQYEAVQAPNVSSPPPTDA